MRRINWTRLFLGGLLAGVVANVVLSGAWLLFLERLGPSGRTRQPYASHGRGVHRIFHHSLNCGDPARRALRSHAPALRAGPETSTTQEHL